MEVLHNPLKFGETLDANSLQGGKTESCQVSLEEKELCQPPRWVHNSNLRKLAQKRNFCFAKSPTWARPKDTLQDVLHLPYSGLE